MREPLIVFEPSGREFRFTEAPSEALRAVLLGLCNIEGNHFEYLEICVAIAAGLLWERENCGT